MFTGIIKKTVKVESIKKQGGNVVVSVRLPAGWKVAEGQSLSVNGICTTVSDFRAKKIIFQYVPETIRKTTVRWWKVGDLLNFEQSLKFGDALDGHLVTGHVEGVGQITAGVHNKGELLFKIETSAELISQMMKKGSVAVDGVSLTIADVGESWFAVALIPYTVAHTNWKTRKVGDLINIETDILGRQRGRNIIANATKTKTKRKKANKRV